MKISEAFKLYNENYIKIRQLCQTTQETHLRTGQSLSSFLGDKDIQDLTVDDIARWIKKVGRGKADNTIRNYLIAVRQTLRYFKLLGAECLNPELIPSPKIRQTIPVFLTASEVSLMIRKAYNIRNKFVISLLYSSGIRLSEMIQLNRGQIVDQQFSVVGKGGKVRLCFIDKRTEKLMAKYLEHRQDNCPALVISARNKARMTPTNVQLLIHNSAKRAGIEKKVTPHTLRHSFATNFLKNNGNMRYLSQMLGHASLETTARYAHVVDYDLRQQYKKFHTY